MKGFSAGWCFWSWIFKRTISYAEKQWLKIEFISMHINGQPAVSDILEEVILTQVVNQAWMCEHPLRRLLICWKLYGSHIELGLCWDSEKVSTQQTPVWLIFSDPHLINFCITLMPWPNFSCCTGLNNEDFQWKVNMFSSGKYMLHLKLNIWFCSSAWTKWIIIMICYKITLKVTSGQTLNCNDIGDSLNCKQLLSKTHQSLSEVIISFNLAYTYFRENGNYW